MEGMGFPGYQLPPGFRFHPTDQELIVHYLRKKVTSSLTPMTSIIADIDLYKFNPWELPDKAFFGEGEWFFFSPRDRKYPNGARPNRAAGSGYWKATGTDKPILASNGTQCLGVKKALVFYKGRPPKGVKTEWIMHEYRLLDADTSGTQKHKGSMRLDDWVLCRVRQKGSLPSLGDEDAGISTTAQSFNTNMPAESHATMARERSNVLEQSDNQLFSYLLGSSEEEESAGQSFGEILGAAKVEEAEPLHQVLNSIKRKLSFSALDEIFLMPPSKRSNSFGSMVDQSSPRSSVSVEEVYSEYLL